MLLTNRLRAEKRVRQLVNSGLHIAVVVPCYNVQQHIVDVVRGIPDYVRYVILVDDCSTDRTGELIDLLSSDRILTMRLPQNGGVGAAMMAGLARAAELDADIVVKLDGDDQMDPNYLPALIEPLLLGKADYTKGNRFRTAVLLAGMPTVRRIGNAVLSFLNKSASGYWNVFDPTNGYVAIRREIIDMLPAQWIHRRFFFESSMLISLGILGAVVLDVPIPARYGSEKSNLRIGRTLFEFPLQMIRGLIRRIWYRKILYSLTMEALLGIFGGLFFFSGLAYGIYGFVKFTLINHVPSPTGVIMAAALSILFGFQMILNAILLDIQSVPYSPLCDRLVIEPADRAIQEMRALEEVSRPERSTNL
jgi:dolichol-phosphate mannosyltransferase